MSKLNVCILFALLIAFVHANNNFALMMDAGSSRTTLYVYTWPQRNTSDVPTVTQFGSSSRVSGGLATFANNLTAIPSYLQPLITFASNAVNSTLHANTSIFLRGTAGMRLLPIGQQNSILDVVRTYLSSTGFRFQSDYASVLSGVDEGTFGWVTANYLLGTFRQRTATVGTLDLGGASTQITYNPQVHPLLDNDTIVFSNGATYTLYAHSFLGYGNDESRNKVSAQLTIGHASGDVVANPCYPIGYSQSLTTSAGTFTIVGSSNFTACREQAVIYLNKNATCPISNCSFSGVYQPSLNLDQDYYGVSSLFYTYDFFQLPSTATLEQLQNATDHFCAYNFTEAKIIYAGNPNFNFLSTYCFLGSYIISLLHEGYGFPMNFSRFHMVSKINNVDVGWTLGAVLQEVDILPWSYVNETSTTGSVTTSMITSGSTTGNLVSSGSITSGIGATSGSLTTSKGATSGSLTTSKGATTSIGSSTNDESSESSAAFILPSIALLLLVVFF